MAGIIIKNGLQANLPELQIGEPAFTIDTNDLYVGGVDGNIKITADKQPEEKIIEGSYICYTPTKEADATYLSLGDDFFKDFGEITTINDSSQRVVVFTNPEGYILYDFVEMTGNSNAFRLISYSGKNLNMSTTMTIMNTLVIKGACKFAIAFPSSFGAMSPFYASFKFKAKKIL